MRLLEIAPKDEGECVITDKMEIKFKDGKEIFKIIENHIVPLGQEEAYL